MLNRDRFLNLVTQAGLRDLPERRDDLHKFMELVVNECALIADQVILGEGRTYRIEFREYFSLDEE